MLSAGAITLRSSSAMSPDAAVLAASLRWRGADCRAVMARADGALKDECSQHGGAALD